MSLPMPLVVYFSLLPSKAFYLQTCVWFNVIKIKINKFANRVICRKPAVNMPGLGESHYFSLSRQNTPCPNPFILS